MQTDYDKYTEIVYAGFWVRLVAFLFDSLIIGVGILIVKLTLSGPFSLLDGTFLGGNLLFTYSLEDIISYVLWVSYYILFIYFTGATPGKRLMNIRVIDKNGGEKISLLNVIYRETVGKFLSVFFVGIGFIMAAFTKQKTSLHDLLADTRVIYAKKVKIYNIVKAKA